VIDDYIAHRREREAQVLAAVRARGSATVAEVVEDVYAGVADELHPVAARTVWAHLRKLADEGGVKGDQFDGEWSAA
jgi:endoribonuclease LACTB2